jgi:hypothetical protein
LLVTLHNKSENILNAASKIIPASLVPTLAGSSLLEEGDGIDLFIFDGCPQRSFSVVIDLENSSRSTALISAPCSSRTSRKGRHPYCEARWRGV